MLYGIPPTVDICQIYWKFLQKETRTGSSSGHEHNFFGKLEKQ